MANRPKVPPKMKEELYREAGMKCANPGCMNYRTHIHHIKEWAVYKTHDEKHMIAVCPSCHDEIHFGKLKISDETIYKWKNIKRTTVNRDHIYIEPNDNSQLILGSVAIDSPSGISVFELSKTVKLTYKVEDEEIFLLDLSITNLKGKEILRISKNHIKYANEEHINYTRRPGRFRITTNRLIDFVPVWAIPIMYRMQPEYQIENGELVLLDMEVLSPGLVKAIGFWALNNRVVIITDEAINFLGPGAEYPTSIAGLTLQCDSDTVTGAVFGFK